MSITIIESCIGNCGREGPVVRRHPGVEGFLCDDCRSFVTIRLIIPSAPVAALSANNRRRGNVWEQRKATAEALEFAQWTIREQYDGPVLPGPFALSLRILWPSGRKGRLPDVDQLGSFCKPVIDALQGIVLADDRQVQRVTFSQERLDKAATQTHYPNGAIVMDLEVM